MGRRKELTVEVIVVGFENGQRIERKWNDISTEEQEVISQRITDRFIDAAGYHHATEEELSELRA